MQTILNKLHPLLLGILLIQLSCSEFSTKPSNDGPQFNVQVSFVDEMSAENLMYSGYERIQKNRSGLNKSAITEAVDQGHILVLDFSKYEDMQAFWGSPEQEAFNATVQKITEDSLSNWSQWISAFEENFDIVTDQSFSVEQDTAFLDVSGVIGLNYFILALTENDLIRYTGEDHGHGEAGESETIYVWMSEWELYEEPEPEEQEPDTGVFAFEVVTTINVGIAPSVPELSQDDAYLYVSNQGDSTVSVISTASNSVIATLNTGFWPKTPVRSPDGNAIWVPVSGASRIDIISTTGNTITDSISLDQGNENKVDEIVFTADGQMALAISDDTNNGSFIQVDTREILNTIDIGHGPSGMIAGYNNNYIFISDYVDNGLHVVNTPNQYVEQLIELGEVPYKPVFASDRVHLYICDAGLGTTGFVHIVNINNMELVQSISVGDSPKRGLFASDGAYFFVPNYDDATVSIIETSNRNVIKNIDVANTPSEGALSSNGDYALFPSWSEGVVSIISVDSQSFRENIDSGLGSQKPVVTRDGNIYISNYHSNSITVIRQK